MWRIIASASICSVTPPDAVTAPILSVDVGAVVANWRSLAALHGGETAAVVKADAYGLGAGLIAPVLARAGCQRFFVATADEAIALRGLIAAPWIAVLNGCPAGRENDFTTQALVPVLNSLADCARWQGAARAAGRALPALLHVDTGMSRLGLDAGEWSAVLRDRSCLNGIELQFVMSHLVSAEVADAPETAAQVARFAAIAAAMPDVATSLANSSGIFLGDTARSDLARPGVALYGGNPVTGQPNPMRAVVTLAAPVLQIRVIGPGETVGYNGTWRAARRSRIATIGVGYADGLPRTLSNRLTARHDGRVVPLVGRVSMDLMTFDVTDLPDIVPGAMVDLIGPDHAVDDLAAEAGTIAYEILTSLGQRYRRVAKSV
uniref:alanine racemase n=1 Tax=Acidiphilium rubrum TaxID=526 RepID=UPI0009F87604|nr:alanine racemase [Acidiphilium rubrum]